MGGQLLGLVLGNDLLRLHDGHNCEYLDHYLRLSLEPI